MVECFNLGNMFTVVILSIFCRLENFNNKMANKKKESERELDQFYNPSSILPVLPQARPLLSST